MHCKPLPTVFFSSVYACLFRIDAMIVLKCILRKPLSIIGILLLFIIKIGTILYALIPKLISFEVHPKSHYGAGFMYGY